MTEDPRHKLSLSAQLEDAQKSCYPCRLCGGAAVIKDAGPGFGYFIYCENSYATRNPTCLQAGVSIRAWAYACSELWNKLNGPPNDAEVRAWALALDETARGHDDAYEDTGHAISKRLADEAREVSGFLTRLSHALAAERKLADDAKRLLEMAQDRCGHNFVGDEYPTFVDFCDAHEARRMKTLAKHGSK